MRDPTACRLQLRAPDRCHLILHPSIAGRIPLLIAEERDDFEALVRALTLKNEPAIVPSSMGACVVSGYVNWHRLSQQYSKASSRNWVPPAPGLNVVKKDSFVILSTGSYSGVDAGQLGLEEEEWLRLSFLIRRDHECAHYFLRRAFPSLGNSLMSELMADYAAIRSANGEFRADWLLCFFGLEAFPPYRKGGRLQNYLTDVSLSAESFDVVCRLSSLASIENIKAFDRRAGG